MSYSNKTHQKPFKVIVEKYCNYLYTTISCLAFYIFHQLVQIPFPELLLLIYYLFLHYSLKFLKLSWHSLWTKILCGSSRFLWINLITYLTCKTHWAWEEQFSVAVWCIMTYDTGVLKGVVGPAGGCATHCTLVTMRSLVLSLASLSTSCSNNNALKWVWLIRTNYLNHIQ